MIGCDPSMRSRRLLIVLVALAAASTDAVALHFSMSAMACCAKAHNECAGFSAPDDCCKGMGRGVSATSATTPSTNHSRVVVSFAILPTPTGSAGITAVSVYPASTFKRPHDPPHLHPAPLLI
jgi:hypothetical protein